MPSLCKRRGKKVWRATVMVSGVRRDKWFPDGNKRTEKAAVLWEEEARIQLAEELACRANETPTACLDLLEWATQYLDDGKMRWSKKTFQEKRLCFTQLLQGLPPEKPLAAMSASEALKHLQGQRRAKSGYGANRDRKNLSAAWSWGKRFLKGFPDGPNPFLAVERFPEERSPRYVPPEEDFYKVLDSVQGQDHVMLVAFLHLAARRGELFRLKWADVDFPMKRMRLTTRKRQGGSLEEDWLPMTGELREALLWWWENRTHKQAEYVFAVTGRHRFENQFEGDPFQVRQHFMKKACERVGVKPFGFHAIRHLTATVLYHAGYPVSTIQTILRHKSPATTERYLKSLGLEGVRGALESLSGRREPGKLLEFKPINNAPERATFEGIL